ncbi:MAG: chalcone isomerase family protein [Pseudomonadota bacterium]|nr:chalcone isomerase family protein [Pseudomonadota bacterium]
MIIRMISSCFLSAALTISVPLAHADVEVKGVSVPEEVTFSGHTMVLNGVGVRTRFFVDAYVAALYLPEVSSDPDGILASGSPLDIRVTIISDMVTGDRFAESAMDGFVRSTHGDLGPIRPQVDTMIKTFRNSLDVGDVFDLVYNPDAGTEIYRNGELQEVVEGLDFRAAMAGIWLSEDPVQTSLRDQMLGL